MQSVSNKRTYHLFGEINNESMKALSTWYREHASEDPASWLQLCITSGGGTNVIGFGMIDFVMSIQKMPLQTIALGEVSSMAIPLFLTGEHRVVSPRTTFFIHETIRSFSKDCSYSTSDLRKALKSLELSQRIYSEFLATRTNGKLSVVDCLKMMEEETRLEAKDAMSLGLAHKISTET